MCHDTLSAIIICFSNNLHFKLQECLADIELAISAGYPAELQYKLLIRRADCYLELNKREQAVEALTKASEQALLLNLTETHTGELTRMLVT